MKNKEGVFMKFYICRKCGSILTDFNHVCAGLTCCGEKVEELVKDDATKEAVEEMIKKYYEMI